MRTFQHLPDLPTAARGRRSRPPCGSPGTQKAKTDPGRCWEDRPWGHWGMAWSCLLPLVSTLPPSCTEASPGKTEANRPAVCPGSMARKRQRGRQAPLSGPKPWLLLPLHATPGSLTPAPTRRLRTCPCQRRGGSPGLLPGLSSLRGLVHVTRIRPNDLIHMLSAKALATELVK